MPNLSNHLCHIATLFCRRCYIHHYLAFCLNTPFLCLLYLCIFLNHFHLIMLYLDLHVVLLVAKPTPSFEETNSLFIGLLGEGGRGRRRGDGHPHTGTSIFDSIQLCVDTPSASTQLCFFCLVALQRSHDLHFLLSNASLHY